MCSKYFWPRGPHPIQSHPFPFHVSCLPRPFFPLDVAQSMLKLFVWPPAVNCAKKLKAKLLAAFLLCAVLARPGQARQKVKTVINICTKYLCAVQESLYWNFLHLCDHFLSKRLIVLYSSEKTILYGLFFLD